MDWDIYLRSVLALCAVIGLIGAVAWLAKRFGLGGVPVGARRKRRLSVVETMALDGRRRLVLVRRDAVEHLLLVGGGSDLIIEGGIATARGVDGRPTDKEDAEP